MSADPDLMWNILDGFAVKNSLTTRYYKKTIGFGQIFIHRNHTIWSCEKRHYAKHCRKSSKYLMTKPEHRYSYVMPAW